MTLLIALGAGSHGAIAQDATPAPYDPHTDLASLSGAVEVAGSATVGPIVEAAAEALPSRRPTSP